MKKYKYKFSVIIPVYNVEEYIGETIQSVINQTIGFKKNIQIILVNDGSPDHSEKICLKFKKKYPNNIIYIKQKNSGVSSARNNGMKYVEGEYINFLDSDDLWEKHTFERVWNFLTKNKDQIDVVACRLKFFGLKRNYQILDYKFDRERIIDIDKDYNCILLSAPSAFIRTDSIGRLRFDENLKYGEDAVFINKIILKKCKYGIEPYGTYLYRKRINENSAVDTATNNQYYYTDSIEFYLKELIRYSKTKLGYLSKFIQCLVLYDLMWRCRSTISIEILNNDTKKKRYFKQIKSLIKLIDDEVIYTFPIMDMYYKLYFLSFKYGNDIYKHLSLQNNNCFFKHIQINNKPIKNVFYKKIRVDKQNVYLHGKVSFLNFDVPDKLVIVDKITGAKYYPEIYRVKSWDRLSCMGDMVNKGYLFRLVIPRRAHYILQHFIYYKKQKFHSDIGFSNPYKISNQYHDYLTLNHKAIFSRNKNNLEICKFTMFLSLKRYLFCMVDLIRKLKLKTLFKKNILFLKKLIDSLFGKLYLKNIIILESNPDFSGNTKEIFDIFIKNHVNEKYKLVWFIDKESDFSHINVKNVEFLRYFGLKALQRSKKTNYYYRHAKIIIDSNKYIKKCKASQIRIHLNHGSPFKNAISYNINIGDIDYDICQSSFFQPIEAKVRDIGENKIIPLGFPRNDILYKKSDFKFQKIDDLKAKKKILWLPTYRSHASSNNRNSHLKFGLPCVKTEKELLALNECLKNNNITLLIKFHPAENLELLESFKLSNIVILKDQEIEEAGITLYHLFSKVDALITDYSSVYFDFCLTKKNIGLAISDIDDYIKENGEFQIKYKDAIIGNYMYNNKDLLDFVKDVAKGRDRTYDKRMKLVKKYDDYQDGKATERVYEFIKKFL